MADVVPNQEVSTINEKCVEQISAQLANSADMSQPQVLAQGENTAGDILAACPVEIYGTVESLRGNDMMPRLSQEELDQTSQQLSGALDWGNAQEVERLLSTLNPDDVARLEAIYKTQTTRDLREDIKYLSELDQRKAELVLDDELGTTNFAANLGVALESYDGGDNLVNLLRVLNSSDISEMKSTFDARYAGIYSSADQEIADASLSSVNRYLVDFFKAGTDNLDAGDYADAAIDLMPILRSNGISKDAAIAALEKLIGGPGKTGDDIRARVAQDSGFAQSFSEMFPPTGNYYDVEMAMKANDLLKYGETSAATIIYQNTYNGFDTLGSIFQLNLKLGSQQAIEPYLASPSVSIENHLDYREGRRLAAQGGELTEEQAKQVEYYNATHAMIQLRGDETQKVIWDDMMAWGTKMLPSKFAEFKRDGKPVDAYVTEIENLSELEWQALRPVDGVPSAHMTALMAVVSSMPEGDTKTRVTELLSSVSTAESLESAKEGDTRDLLDQVWDNNDTYEEGSFRAIARAVMGMTDEDLANYLSSEDPSYREQIDAVVFPAAGDTMKQPIRPEDVAAMVLTQQLLRQVQAGGDLPSLEKLDEMGLLAKDLMEGKSFDRDTLINLQNGFIADDDFRTMALKVINASDYGTWNTITSEELMKYNMVQMLDVNAGFDFKTKVREGGGSITTELAGDNLLSGESEYTNTYRELDATEQYAETNEYTEDQKKIYDNITLNNGEMHLADEMYSFIIGDRMHQDPKYFVDELSKMSPEALQSFQEELTRVYGADARQRFVDAVSASHPDPEFLKVVQAIASEEQNFSVRLEDKLRLHVLSGSKDYMQYAAEIDALDDGQIQDLKTVYNNKYESLLAPDFLGTIEGHPQDLETFEQYFTAAPVDPVQSYLDRIGAEIGGWDTDGTREQVENALNENPHLLAAYSAARESIPQDVLAQLDAEFFTALKANRDSRERTAAFIDQTIGYTTAVIALGAAFTSGGLSLTLLGGSGAISLSRVPLTESAVGDMWTEERRNEQIIATVIETLGVGIEAGFIARNMFRAVKPLPDAAPANMTPALESAPVDISPLPAIVQQGGLEPSIMQETVNQIVPRVSLKDTLRMNGLNGMEDDLGSMMPGGMDAGGLDPSLGPDFVFEPPVRVTNIGDEINLPSSADVLGIPNVPLQRAVVDGAETTSEVGATVSTKTGALSDEAAAPVLSDGQPTAAIKKSGTPEGEFSDPELNLVIKTPEGGPLAGELVEEVAEALPKGPAKRGSRRAVVKDPDGFNEPAVTTPEAEPFLDPMDPAFLYGKDATTNSSSILAGIKQSFANTWDNFGRTEGPWGLRDDAWSARLAGIFKQTDEVPLGPGPRIGATMDDTAPLAGPRVAGAVDDNGFVIPPRFAAVADDLPVRTVADDMAEAGAPIVAALTRPERFIPPLLATDEAIESLTAGNTTVEAEMPEPVVGHEPNLDLIALATVRRGEGPWQTAERILAASGAEYDVMEVRALSKAIKAIYAADENNPDIAGLKVNHQFITEGNFEQLLQSVQGNEAVHNALLAFAA